MTPTVPFVAVAAREARPGRVPGVHHPHRDTEQAGLVLDERSELGERPVAESSPVRFRSRSLRAVADVREVFKDDAATECLRVTDDGLTDRVVGVFLEPCLPTAEFPQTPTTVPGVPPLVGGSGSLCLLPSLLHSTAAELRPGAGGGDVHDAEINADPPVRNELRFLFNFHTGEKQPPPVTAHEVRLPFQVRELTQVLLRAPKRDSLPPQYGSDLNCSITEKEPYIPPAAGLKWNRCGRAEFWTTTNLHHLKSVGHLLDDANGHVGGKAELLSGRVVGDLLDIERPPQSVRKSESGHRGAGRIKSNHRLGEGERLLDCGFQVQRKGYFHDRSIPPTCCWRDTGCHHTVREFNSR